MWTDGISRWCRRPLGAVGVAVVTGLVALALSDVPARAAADRRPVVVAVTPNGLEGGLTLPASVQISYMSNDARPPTAVRFGGMLACGVQLEGCPRPTGRRPNLSIAVPVPAAPPLSTKVTAPTTEAVCVQVEVGGTSASTCHQAFGGLPPRAITPCPAAPFDGASFCYAIAPAPLPEPNPGPGGGSPDAGTPVDPPPPEGATGAVGPGTPDAGTATPPAFTAMTCTLQPDDEEQLCFTLDGATQFDVKNPWGVDLEIVEKHAPDSMVLRTTPLGQLENRVISFMPNTTVTVVNKSSFIRPVPITIEFANGTASYDFLCEVPVHDPYSPFDWGNHTQCTWSGGRPWLATFHNYGDRPVDVNEWYGNKHRGRTEVLANESKVLPLESGGSFYVGVGGPARSPIKVSVTEYQDATLLLELWVRSTASLGFGSGRFTYVLANISPYQVELEWQGGEVGGSTVLKPGERYLIERFRHITGAKDFGNGEIARVLFLKPEAGGADGIYLAVSPRADQPAFPLADVTLVAHKYRSVRVENLGPRTVDLHAWSIPFLSQVGATRLEPGQSGTLPLTTGRQSAVWISATVDDSFPGSFAQVKLTEWIRCCDTQFTAAVASLTGNATRVGDGVDAGQVWLSGRFTLTPTSDRLDLAAARVTLVSLLDEAGAAGELVDRVATGPISLVARSASTPTAAIFESPPAPGHAGVRMEVYRRSTGALDFTLKVSRAVLSRDPRLCSAAKPSTTTLRTRFLIDDGQHPPVEVSALGAWECVGSGSQGPRGLTLR